MSENIGIIGNGFDKAHGLLTGYDDFLEILKRMESFKGTFFDACNGKIYEKSEWKKYFNNLSHINKDHVNQMTEIIEKNVWAYYYGHCEAEMKGWIDFESEILPVLRFFDYIFNTEINISSSLMTGKPVKGLSASQERTASLLKKYIGLDGSIKKEYISKSYGLLSEKILDDLKQEFLDFLDAMKIYFCEFVDKIEIERLNNSFFLRKYDKLFSFNYTCTDEKYELCEEKTIHIHGSIKDSPCNFVLGVEDLEWDKDNRFIFFTKSFQRIQKHIFMAPEFDNINEDSFLYVYGHSLGKHDHEILKKIFLKVRSVTLYYYNQSDYEQKVANLIQMLGRDELEKRLASKQIYLTNV